MGPLEEEGAAVAAVGASTPLADWSFEHRLIGTEQTDCETSACDFTLYRLWDIDVHMNLLFARK